MKWIILLGLLGLTLVSVVSAQNYFHPSACLRCGSLSLTNRQYCCNKLGYDLCCQTRVPPDPTAGIPGIGGLPGNQPITNLFPGQGGYIQYPNVFPIDQWTYTGYPRKTCRSKRPVHNLHSVEDEGRRKETLTTIEKL
ncbi:uncharacterized protein LOC143240142 [Tachypleus tridentatus]|uniref:uncharacterized protein LOC143240142 n=1 Tax=Tachypleus tridentatus TaxID=6853 RepID=UPI003FD0266D